MKTFLYTLLLLINSSLWAQSPILDINTDDYPRIENAYYKDLDNFYDQFVGTWVYTDPNKTIRFRFVKKEMFYYQSAKNYYEDFLVGEMQYIESMTEKINSLGNLLENHTSIFDYSLYSIGKTYNHWYPVCGECPPTTERMAMSYDEPTNNDRSLEAAFIMRRLPDHNGVQRLRIQYVFTNGPSGYHKNNIETPSTTTNFTIPYGEYTLIKQN